MYLGFKFYHLLTHWCMISSWHQCKIVVCSVKGFEWSEALQYVQSIYMQTIAATLKPLQEYQRKLCSRLKGRSQSSVVTHRIRVITSALISLRSGSSSNMQLINQTITLGCLSKTLRTPRWDFQLSIWRSSGSDSHNTVHSDVEIWQWPFVCFL